MLLLLHICCPYGWLAEVGSEDCNGPINAQVSLHLLSRIMINLKLKRSTNPSHICCVTLTVIISESFLPVPDETRSAVRMRWRHARSSSQNCFSAASKGHPSFKPRASGVMWLHILTFTAPGYRTVPKRGVSLNTARINACHMLKLLLQLWLHGLNPVFQTDASEHVSIGGIH